MEQFKVSTYYSFKSLDQSSLQELQVKLLQAGEARGIHGLFLISTEGCNATICGRPDQVDAYKQELQDILNIHNMIFKDSFADRQVFHRFKVKIRQEIVTIGRPDLVPSETHHNHLPPDEWDRVLREEDVVVIDTRNDYEYEVGHFKGAIDPKIKKFTEFAEYVRKQDTAKDKKILIYCTGGIRCEKAILDMEEAGYTNVYQLEGGILNYLQKHPHSMWDGECFVFDHRVAVDQELQPSKRYSLCPHCGDPATEHLDCVQCGVEAVVCKKCLAKDDETMKTCSKNCAHHFKLGHKTTRIHEDARNKRTPRQRASS